jgi:hypothetical protein
MTIGKSEYREGVYIHTLSKTSVFISVLVEERVSQLIAWLAKW